MRVGKLIIAAACLLGLSIVSSWPMLGESPSAVIYAQSSDASAADGGYDRTACPAPAAGLCRSTDTHERDARCRKADHGGFIGREMAAFSAASHASCAG